MTENFKCVSLQRKPGEKYPLDFLGEASAERVHSFHKSFDAYSPTPLRELQGLAGQLGLKSFYLKDESYRFGLNAFKVLGGSYAIGQYIANRLGEDIFALPYRRMISDCLLYTCICV